MLKSLDRNIGRMAYTLWDKKEGGVRLDEYARLSSQQNLNAAALEKIQTHKLNQLLKHAQATSPWYRRLMHELKIDLRTPLSLGDLRHFPVTTKADIREHTDAFISEAYQPAKLKR